MSEIITVKYFMDSKKHSKKTIYINEGFDCEKCGVKNEPAPASCRNHCTECLYSKHIDDSLPGDRLSGCGGLMEPILITQKSGKPPQIVHQCLKCNKKISNITAKDDNIDSIIKIMQIQNIQNN